MAMNPEELKKEVDKIQWWHTIDLGHGIVTPGYVNYYKYLDYFKLPASFKGKTVLDIGAWDGFFSFEAERRGAQRVLAVDSNAWKEWTTQKGFNLARKALDSKVEDKLIEVLDLSPETVGVFDVVLFLGVLYHMRHPLLALEKVFKVTRDLLILETHVDLLSVKKPAMKFYPGAEFRHDPTNWWGPNPQAVKAMLKDVGFQKVEMVSDYFPHRFGIFGYLGGRYLLRRGRVVFYAYRQA